jgi:hypothetical protein
MEIIVKVKEVYGIQKVYPVCPKAKAIARIAGTKTLTDHTLQEIDVLGFTLKLQERTLDDIL